MVRCTVMTGEARNEYCSLLKTPLGETITCRDRGSGMKTGLKWISEKWVGRTDGDWKQTIIVSSSKLGF